MMSSDLTNGLDLTRLMSSCNTCSLAVAFGSNIRHHEEIRDFKDSNTSGTRSAYCLNSKSLDQSYGHWTVLVRFKNTMYLCDGLQYIPSRLDVMNNIHSFCKLNGYKLILLPLRYQLKASSNCGFLSLGIIAKYHTLSFSKFISMISALQRNSIRSNEQFFLRFAKKHFGFDT